MRPTIIHKNNDSGAHRRRGGWLAAEDKYLQACYPIAQLLDLALASDVPQHKLLRGTGIFVEDLASQAHVSGGVRFNVRQLAVLADNIAHYLPQDEIASRWGARLWPGYAGPFSQTLAGPRICAMHESISWLSHTSLAECLWVESTCREVVKRSLYDGTYSSPSYSSASYSSPKSAQSIRSHRQ